MKFATLFTSSSIHTSRISVFKDTTTGPVISKEMKYNLHYGEVRGDVLRPPHGVYVNKIKVKLIQIITRAQLFKASLA